MEDYTYDYINGTDTYLHQHKKMSRIDTNTTFLMQFMRVKKGERALDIGTNNRALLLVAHRYVSPYLHGIDIQPKAITVAEKNMEHHHVTNVVLATQDTCDAALERVDVIVCNPPYSKVDQESSLDESQSLQMARHEHFLILRTLCQRVSELLDEKGCSYMVYRASRISEIAYTLKQHCLEIRTLQFVYDANREETAGILAETVKDGRINARVLLSQIIEQ